jgi:phosphate/sulfate permease
MKDIIIAIFVVGHVVVADAWHFFWVTAFSATAIILDILSVEWMVIKNSGNGNIDICPYQGFTASMSGDVILSFVITFSLSISKTHVLKSRFS